MRKNAPRKWLHAVLDLLPVILIPVFMIYSHRHTIDSGSIQVPQNEVVDFNQLVRNGNFENYNYWSTSSRVSEFDIIENKGVIISTDGSTDNTVIYTPIDNMVNEHKYYISFNVQLSTYVDYSWPYINMYNQSDSYYGGNDLTTTNIYRITYSFTSDADTNSYLYVGLRNRNGIQMTYYVSNVMLFDLTQMFGSGNEPTIQQFNDWFSDSYYAYTLSHKELLKDTTTIIYDDTDIMSQSIYQLYNSVDKYFNMNNIFNMGAVYDWFVLNVFSGNAPIIMFVVWNIALYELVMDLMFLLYALFMWFVDWCKSLIERTYDVGKGK